MQPDTATFGIPGLTLTRTPLGNLAVELDGTLLGWIREDGGGWRARLRVGAFDPSVDLGHTAGPEQAVRLILGAAS